MGLAPKEGSGVHPSMGPLVAPDGGGVELAQFFARILERAYKQGPITLQDAREAISLSHNNLFPRMRYLYRAQPGDGVDACVRAVLDQLVLRKMLREENGHWSTGRSFHTDKPLRVLPLADGWLSVSVRSDALSEEELQRRLDMPDDELLRRAFAGEENLGFPDEELQAVRGRLQRYFSATARLLQPENAGLRPVGDDETSRTRINVIKDSVRRYGLRPEFPILLDKKGRILSGRHRLAAAAELLAEGIIEGPWPQSVLPLEKDEDAVLVALAANAASPWTKRDFEYLRKVATPEEGPREKTRRLIVLALLQDRARDGPKHGDKGIARLVGCSDHTVKAVRVWLEEKAQIALFRAPHGSGRGHTEALPVPDVPDVPQQQEVDEEEDDGPAVSPARPALPAPPPSQQEVLDVLAAQGPLSDRELKALPELSGGAYSTVPTHRKHLVERGLVRDSGQRAQSAAGKPEIRWEAVPADAPAVPPAGVKQAHTPTRPVVVCPQCGHTHECRP